MEILGIFDRGKTAAAATREILEGELGEVVSYSPVPTTPSTRPCTSR